MDDLNKYRDLLETELETLTSQLKDLGVHNPAVKEDWIPLPHDVEKPQADENVVADRSEDWQETRGTLDALETRFNNINRALKKITEGDFGKCEICNEEIETDRLDVNPAARTCKTHLNEESNLSQ